MSKELLRLGKLELDYESVEGGRVQLSAVRGHETGIIIESGWRRAIRADFRGWVRRVNGAESNRHHLSLTVWFDVELERPVAFESEISGVNLNNVNNRSSRERVELVNLERIELPKLE